MTNGCQQKCISSHYKEGDLSKGEAVCLDRCVAKYLDIHERLGKVGYCCSVPETPITTDSINLGPHCNHTTRRQTDVNLTYYILLGNGILFVFQLYKCILFLSVFGVEWVYSIQIHPI